MISLKERLLKKKIKQREHKKIKLLKHKFKTDVSDDEEIPVDDSVPDQNNYSNQTPFSSLKDSISEETLRAISDMGFTHMTEIQTKAIRPLLELNSLIGNAKTGSGKTLAYLIPAVELMAKLRFKPRNGTGCIILEPTRELAIQTFGVLQELMKYHRQTFGIVMGQANRKIEAIKLQNGINILVGVPGRLLDHIRNTQHFRVCNTLSLVIDEADLMLEYGFQDEIQAIVNNLPFRVQTALFSATSEKTGILKKLLMKQEPLYVGVGSSSVAVIPEKLQQGYLEVPTERRFDVLANFLHRFRNKKVMVFFSTRDAVHFYDLLFNLIDIPVLSMHGKQEQGKRSRVFFQFSKAERGALLCTDVAARGLDYPEVDVVLQYDPPEDVKEYIHRVGRTARGEHRSGLALLMLRPEELGFLDLLAKAGLPVDGYAPDRITDVQHKLESVMRGNKVLREAASRAYISYVRSYDSHRLKSVFDIQTLDLYKVALSFGLLQPPPVENLTIQKKTKPEDGEVNTKKKKHRKKMKIKI